MGKCRVLAVCNQKGGVGKSVTAISLGVGLAGMGERVCLVDLDPQGSATISLGVRDENALKVTIAELLQGVIDGGGVVPKGEYIKQIEEVDLIPSDIRLAGVENSLLNSMFGRENKLKSFISSLREDYSYILIDCPPTLTMLTINALVAADSVLIPVQAQHLATAGLVELLKTVSMVRQQINPALLIEGVLMTMCDGRTNMTKNTVEAIREAYSGHIRIFDTEIPMSVKASEATCAGMSVFKYAPQCKLAAAYKSFVKELASNGE